ncbi:uncharacterized protein PAC_16065 [Phialocephala subalpina]|uniref:DUF1740-domain-containing protein n=1 Tax=Phialocephala subalpina TaxID=576137 RepID=A0A1L7XMC4_9HELO|nr:uncharacterized protein PAC_16065 [Phialocephala subalpina]
MSEPKTSIPKFGSFRPKPTQQQVEAQPQPKSRDEDKKLSQSRPEKERKSSRHKRHRSRSRERSHARSKDLDVSRVIPVEASPDIFIIDRKGDVKNLVYGSIHRYSVPNFYRYGSGYVLGASLDLKIDRDLDDGREVVLRNWKVSKSGRREKYVFARVEKEKPRLLKLRPEAVAKVQEYDYADFVPLQAPREKRRKRGERGGDSSSDSDENSRDYRSIYGKAKDHDQPQDPDLQYATESDSSGSETGRAIKLDTSVRDKNVKLSRKVEEFPHDINAWLELIEHQDALIRAGDDRRRITNAETRSTADIKIHMYEKALEKTRSLGDRERLLLGLMAEGVKIWELKVQTDRWEQIAKENIDSLLLWSNYLNFKQSAFSTFRYEEIKGLYMKRIKLLLAIIEKSGTDSVDSLYQQILYVFLRFSLFVRESGYSELSVAIWQGLLELNFCAPKQQLPQQESTKLFQQFWDSEVPRLGEDGALGWRKYLDNEDSSNGPDASTDEAHGSLQRSKIFKSWAAAERLRSKCSRMPARTMDEVIEDDPFRVILFSDIEDFLISLPNKFRTSCIDAFLLFCRLPVLASNDEEPRIWSMDQFIRNDLLDWGFAKLRQELSTTEHTDDEAPGLTSSFQPMLPNSHATPESLFTASSLQQKPRWQEQYGGDHGPVPYRFIRNALKQLTQASFTEDLAQYYMAFESINEPETIKKIAKGLLKQHPSSLKLYNAYALIEWSRGNKDVAKGVFSAALSMSQSNTDTESKPDSILLWKSLTWCCLEDGDKTAALIHLFCIPDGVPNAGVTPSPAGLLRAKQHITSIRDFLLSSGDPEHAVQYSECLILLEYLTGASTKETTSTSQGDIATALDIITTFSTSLQSRGYKSHQETLLQSATRLLVHHSNAGPYRPSLIRQYLTNFLTLFPQNTLFLTLYTANEARVQIDNRVRSLFLSIILTPANDCLTSRLFAIQYEMHFGTIHSVKSAFEKAVSSPTSKSSPGLWRFYLLWTVENESKLGWKAKGKGLAKEIWYRVLRACPWAKELYVLGLEVFGESKDIDFRELRGTWRVLGEKELRVHVDLEEEFDDIDEDAKRRAIEYS